QMGDTTANVWAPVWQDSNQDLNLMLLAAGQFPPGANPAAQAAKQAARGYPRTSLPPTPRPVSDPNQVPTPPSKPDPIGIQIWNLIFGNAEEAIFWDLPLFMVDPNIMHQSQCQLDPGSCST